MSALQRQTYANSTQPLFQPYGSGNLPSQVLQYALPSGTPGGQAPGGSAYYQRPINEGLPALTQNGDSTAIPGMNLTNNQFTLPPGTYAIQGSAVGLMTVSKVRLFDVTHNSTAAIGLASGSEQRNALSTFYTELTILEPTTYEAQFWGFQSSGVQDYGQPVGAGDDEIYLQILVTKEE